MKKIILFIPYYGKLPNYFVTWAKSIEHLDGFVDFIFVTDIEAKDIVIPNNLKIIKLPFIDLQAKAIQKNIVPPTHPYKLCDYKPVYGRIFEELIIDDEYEYWGYCDIDTVFGDIKGFLLKIDYQQYDRIGSKGHFTIYKNNEQTKSLFNYELTEDTHPYHHFKYVVNTTYPCHFDEDGMNVICKHLGLKFFEKSLEFNTTFKCKHIHTYNHTDLCELLTWENGHTFRYLQYNQGTIKKEEQMYIHFQFQKDMPQVDKLDDCFFLCFDGFRNFNVKSLEKNLTEFGRPDNKIERDLAIKQYNQIVKRQRIMKIKRELQTNGIKSIRNFFTRIPSIFNAILKY